MLRERNRLIVQAHKVLDICLTAAGFIGAYYIKKYLLPESFRGLTPAANYNLVLLMIVILWYLTFGLFGLYASYRKLSFGQIFWNMVKAVSAAMFVLILCMYLFKVTDVSRIMMGIFLVLNIGFLTLSKGIAYKLLTHYRKKGFNFRNILIIGSKERAKDLIDTIGRHVESGFKVVGCLEMDQSEVGKEVKGDIKVIGTLDQLRKILLEKVIDEAIFTIPLSNIRDANAQLAVAEEIGVPVRIIPDWQIYGLGYQPNIATIQLEEFLGLPTLALTTTPTKQAELLIKNAFDYVVAAITLLAFLPIFIFIACAIKVASKGPVFFRQERCGLNGRKFVLYKFRTMVADAEMRREELAALNEADGPAFKIEKDPRIIPIVGSFLRKTGLDELPQLINMLKGEMSLIGPRPPIPEEVKKYDFWQRRRLSMKPGLTCLWQCSDNRNEVSFTEWMNMDLSYIDRWSLALDFKILLKTARVILMGGGR